MVVWKGDMRGILRGNMKLKTYRVPNLTGQGMKEEMENAAANSQGVRKAGCYDATITRGVEQERVRGDGTNNS